MINLVYILQKGDFFLRYLKEMNTYPDVSSPKLMNGFIWNFVSEIFSNKSCRQASSILVHIYSNVAIREPQLDFVDCLK
jgi:hypothetical protein